MTVVFTIFTGITIYFVYYNWSLIKNKVSCIKSNTHKKINLIKSNHKMETTKEINIKNQTDYFYNDINDI